MLAFVFRITIGAILYAVRGGNYGTEKWPNIGLRLIYSLSLGLTAYYETYTIWQSPAFSALSFATICLGHGLFMDMGRFKPSGFRIEHEKPLTLIPGIGPENYNWPFWRRWIHNCGCMSLLGVIRHLPALVFIGLVPYQAIANYVLAGLLHGPLYELGHQIGRLPILNRVPLDKRTLYGEHLVGGLQFGLLAYLF